MEKCIIFLKKELNVFIIKKKKNLNLYFYNKYFFLTFFLNDFLTKKKIVINKNFKFIEISKSTKYLNELLNNTFFFFLNKFKFDGKGFKIKKIKKVVNFNFNNSHIKTFIEKRNKFLKISKNSFLIVSKQQNNKLFFYLKNFLKSLFKMNIYTRRGVRLNRCLIYLKKTKKK